MAIIRQTEWLDGADHPHMQSFIESVIIAAVEGGCVVCRAAQPDDVRWPAYEMEYAAKDGSGETTFHYRACKTCAPKLAVMLTRLGAPERTQ